MISSRRSAGIGCPARDSIVWMIRSKSSFFTSSPLTRAMIGGSVAGTGLGGAGAAAPGVPGSPGAAVEAGVPDPAGVAAVAAFPAGALRHALIDTDARNTQRKTLDLT